MNLKQFEIWYVTGSQHLYGQEALKKVAEHRRNRRGVERLDRLPLKIVFKPVLTTPDEIRNFAWKRTTQPKCAGFIIWMHTFSPSKMWIGGLAAPTSRSCICTRNSIATCRGRRSTWIS